MLTRKEVEDGLRCALRARAGGSRCSRAALALAGAGGGVALAVAGSSGGRYVQAVRASVPAAKVAPIEHAQPGTAPESTVPAPVPAGTIAAIPAALMPGGSAPVPVSPALVRVRNGWLVSDGRTLVAVYAGAAGDDGRNGRFVIVRQNLVGGHPVAARAQPRRDGALTIVRAPLGAGVERSAQWGSLGFRSANGRTGTLDLRLGRAALAP